MTRGQNFGNDHDSRLHEALVVVATHSIASNMASRTLLTRALRAAPSTIRASLPREVACRAGPSRAAAVSRLRIAAYSDTARPAATTADEAAAAPEAPAPATDAASSPAEPVLPTPAPTSPEAWTVSRPLQPRTDTPAPWPPSSPRKTPSRGLPLRRRANAGSARPAARRRPEHVGRLPARLHGPRQVSLPQNPKLTAGRSPSRSPRYRWCWRARASGKR